MRIGINAQLLSPTAGYRQAGLSGYILNLLRHFWDSDHRVQWVVYAARGVTHRMLQAPNHVDIRDDTAPFSTDGPTSRIFWEQMIAPVAASQDGIDVLFCPVNVVPLLAPCPTVVTVHDVAFLRYNVHRRVKRAYLSQMTAMSLRRATHVISVSEFTRREILDIWPSLGPSQVTAVPNGRDERFSPVDAGSVEAFRRRVALPARYLLFVGTLEPRKNLQTLIRAFHRVRDRLKMPLVVVGGKGWLYHDVFQTVVDLGLERDVIFTGFVPADDLPLYYAAADAFVYPSMYEGFGLPLLEAMSIGTPVVTTSVSSLPEVAGNAALLVPPLDVGAMGEALVQVTSEPSVRQRLREEGFQRALAFSWKTAADRTLKILVQAAGTN